MGFLLIVITPIGIRNYIPILFGCATFVIFGINANGYWYKFSKEPEIFKNNEVPFGYNKGKLVQFTTIFEDDTFKNISDKELYKRYLDLKTYGLLVIYAFLQPFFSPFSN
ncbi:hypothetical protein [Flavobacterium sp.]|uniref:hypothetical protein n=1 Tax=Flavobacterium sp. TaxID=239 RepID=UPI003D0982ED